MNGEGTVEQMIRKISGGFDPRKLRGDFSILNTTLYGSKKLLYLDNAATTQKPASVLGALYDYYQASNASVHRSLHFLAGQATHRFEEARKKVARFIGAPGDRSVVFTRGATESINLVAHGWGRKFIKAGEEIVLTEMEHHSNLVPWQLLAREKGAILRFIPVKADGTLDLVEYQRLLSARVRLVAVNHVSNVLGTVNPVHRMIEWAHAAGAVTLVDAAQSVPGRPVNVAELDCDFLAFSGHKMLAPTGIGILYGKEALLTDMDPFMGGGEMINRVEFNSATWADIPQKFEAGTPPIAGAVGLGAAVDYLAQVGMANIEAYDGELTRYALKRLSAIPGLRIFGAAPERSGAVSFEVDGIHPHDLAQFLDTQGVAIRAGDMCAQPLLRKLGVAAVSRASFYFYNLPEEADLLVEGLLKAKDYFRHGTR